MKPFFLFLFSVFIIESSFSQNNNEIRSANELVEYMSQSSFLSLRLRTELIQVAEGIEHQEEDENINYCHTHYNPKNKISSSSDFHQNYSELKMTFSDDGKTVSFPSSYLDIMNFIVEKYKIQEKQNTRFYQADLRLNLLKTRYVELNDSIWNLNEQIQEYVYAKKYLSDPELAEAKGFLKLGEHLLKANFEQFIDCLDKGLQEVNSDYEAKRYNNMTLNRPIVHKARKKLFIEWMASRGKLGGQNKVPRLANTREFIEPLIELNNRS